MNITRYKTLILLSISVFLSTIAVLAQAKSYKSAEIYTQDAMLYGKYVIRMRAAKGSGIISNFFLWKEGSELSSVFWEEVDIEVFGKDNAQSLQSNIITGLGSRITSEQVHSADFSYADGYHTFVMEWTPDYIAWSVDGVEIRRSQGGQVDDLLNPSTMRFNFWPPNIPSWVGVFNESILPVEMYVNWVEYHQWNGSSFDLSWRDDFNTFDTNRWTKANHTFAENLADFVPANAVVKNGYLVLAMTHEGQEGYNGNPPEDNGDDGGDNGDDGGDNGDDGGDNGDDGGDNGDDGGDNGTTFSCTYIVDSEWATGFTAKIELVNGGSSSQQGWSVNWAFDDGSQVVHSWNANLSKTGNTYSATPLSWNSTINPNASASFGFVGQKGQPNTPASVPQIVGDVCED